LQNPATKYKLTSKNTAALLSNGVYMRHPEEEKSNPKGDLDFQIMQDAIMDAIKSKINPIKAVGSIAEIVSDRRLLAWFSDEKLGKTVEGNNLITKVAGKIPEDDKYTNIGVYVNDVEPSKVDFYMDFNTEIKRKICITEASTYYDVTVGQKSKISRAEGEKLPKYIHDGQVVRTDFYVVAPDKAEFLGFNPLIKEALQESGLYKSANDPLLHNRFVARTRAYTPFGQNKHHFLFKKAGLDFKKMNIITTPSFNRFKVKESTSLGCPKPSSDMTTVNASEKQSDSA
jgi:hypothetical protein